MIDKLLTVIAALCLTVTPGLGCDSSNQSQFAQGTDDPDGSAGDTDTDADTDGDTDSDSDGDSDTDADTDTSEEICDGEDNDGNGIIDDVDEGGDGICDCLNIGTIGRIGPWSSGGNIFKTWLDTRSPIPATDLGDQEITPDLISGLQVIVVLRADAMPLARDETPAHHEFSPSEVAALESWVRDGGGLMTTIGYQADESTEVQNVNRLLAPLGVHYHHEPSFLELTGPIDKWADHSIADSVSVVKIINGVEPATDGGTAIAWSGDDKVAMVITTPGDGHVIVFGDEWITYDSEWENVTDLQVERLWLNMISWLSPPKECQVPPPIV